MSSRNVHDLVIHKQMVPTDFWLGKFSLDHFAEVWRRLVIDLFHIHLGDILLGSFALYFVS